MTTLETLNIGVEYDQSDNFEGHLAFQGHTFGCSCCENKVIVPTEEALAELRKISEMYTRMAERYAFRARLLEVHGFERISQSRQRLEVLDRARDDLKHREDDSNIEMLKQNVLAALSQMCQPLDRDINNAFGFINDSEL